jgi:hypothetical protein
MATYLNFPIMLIKNIFLEKRSCINFIIGFSIYQKASNEYEQVTAECMDDVADELNINLGNSKRHLQLCHSFIKKLNSPDDLGAFVGINNDILFDYLKNDKTEFQIAAFCAFCAVRSILGKKVFCKTNKALIHARMFGYRSAKQLPDKMTEIQKKYLNRYHMDKLIQELELNWHLKLFGGHCRGFYLSFDLSHCDLAMEHNKAKKKVKVDALKEKKKAALDFVKSKSKSESPSATEKQLYSIKTA